MTPATQEASPRAQFWMGLLLVAIGLFQAWSAHVQAASIPDAPVVVYLGTSIFTAGGLLLLVKSRNPSKRVLDWMGVLVMTCMTGTFGGVALQKYQGGCRASIAGPLVVVLPRASVSCRPAFLVAALLLAFMTVALIRRAIRGPIAQTATASRD